MKRMLLLALLVGCSDDAGGGNEGEVITTVLLEFGAPGGVPVTFTFDDPDGDGGNPPTTVDMITLTNGSTYLLAIRFQNRLESPPEEITTEVVDEGDQHQVFFTGSAVKGPATSNTVAPLEHMYSDTDARGLPVGILNEVTATTGTGQLVVTLRHMPPVNDTPVKTSDTATQVKNGGFAAISGKNDANVTFEVRVQ